MKFLHLLFLGVVLTGTTRAADPVDPSVKLRAQLREVMLQLRSAQTESANAQAEKLAADQKVTQLTDRNKALETRIAGLIRQADTDKVATDKTAAELEAKIAGSQRRLTEITANRDEWKAGYQNAAEVARTKEAERAKFFSELTSTKLTLADRERKNIALFNVSNEILDRYEAYALGKALGAREPFIGTTRVKVETQVQGYKDKILDNRIAAPAKP
jgi:chromosome segregation ATPase